MPIKEPFLHFSDVVELLGREYERRAQIRPLSWSKHMTLQLKDVFTRLKLVCLRNVHRKRSEVNVQHIFGSSEKRNTMVLVQGSPGIGKTSFCLKHAYDWANTVMPLTFPVFDFVFLLKCRDMNRKIMDAITEQLLPEDIQERTGWETFLNFIEGSDNQKRILIILDGLDELPEADESRHDVDKVLKRKIFPFCYVLATARKRKGIEVRKKFKFDICLEIKGFSEDESFEYIRKHFRDNEASQGERLIEQIKERPALRELTLIPLHLILLCSVFEDCEGNLPSSGAQLYQTILTCLLRRHCERHNLEASEEDADLQKQFESAIVCLGDQAWKCLLNDRLSFSENEIISWESNEHIELRGLGLVYKEESCKILNPQNEYFFFHKTFQEYLAALSIAHHLRRNEFNVFEQVSLKDLTGKFRLVFTFVCVILDEKAGILFREISEALPGHWDLSRCDESLIRFFDNCILTSQNRKRMGDTLCPFFRLPRVQHLSFQGPNDGDWYLAGLLGSCSTDSIELVPAEVHITAEYFFISEDDSILTALDDLPNVRSIAINIKQPLPQANDLDALLNYPSLSALTLPAVSDVTSAAAVKDYLTSSTSLEKVTFTLIGKKGEGWSKLLYKLTAGSSLLSTGLKIYGSLSQPALQAVKNFLLNKRRFHLPINIEGDVPDALASVLKMRPCSSKY